MIKKRVKSSNIKYIGYNPQAGDKGLLFVRFRDGSAYAYEGVSKAVFDAFAKAESAGKFFAAAIKGGGYKHKKFTSRQ